MGIAVRCCGPVDLERLIPLLDEEFVFGKGRTISLRHRFPTVFCRDNLSNIMLCTDGEVIISALAMRPFDWCAEGEIFRGAMIGAVYTHPTRRGEGWAGRLLEAAAARLREEGMDFGVLWTGRPAFYARHGWMAADCGVFGEVEVGQALPEASGDVTIIPAPAGGPLLEGVRRRRLDPMVLRNANDYRQLPLPVSSVDVLWRENHGGAAYALLGGGGESGFLYELAGAADGFPALWREACRGRRRIFVNDRADSPSCRWLTDRTGISWRCQNQAMWLPLSERVTMSLLGQWVVPYFDRI